ncbi:MFS transporter [Mycolicibacterium litorale]|uniref:MFS transporter n=2 Tax=Mycolicibacterium litorale TaxID=758802 RepID=A0AAD1IQC9_9MYCO|nr:MFS transporter [Mycolicibacterium litorale]
MGIVAAMASGVLDEAVRDRRARVAVGAQFLTNGALFANLLPRYPEIKADLALSNAVYGITIAAFSAGAFVAGLTAAALIRRFTSARVAVAGTVAIAIFMFAAGLAPSPVLLAGALFLAGASDAVTDVAQNAHALRVQRHYGRSIINSVHAVWAGGAVLGGLMGAGAIALHIPRAVHLGVAAAVFIVVVLIAYRFMLPGADHDDHPAAAQAAAERVSGRKVYLLLTLLAVIAIAGATVEDAGSSWATLYLRDSVGAPGAVAAFGYIALVAFLFVGRLIGDRLVDRFGETRVARAGGALAAAGMGAALAFPSVPATIAGFAAAGLGVATAIPAAMHCADQLPGLRPGTGLTVVTWLLRIGFLASPPVVGLVADSTSLRVGLLSVPLAGLVIVVLAGVLNVRARPGP